MYPDLMERPINERFDHLLKVMRSQRFLTMAGLGNEVPFFICPFHPQETNEFIRMAKQLENRLARIDIRVLAINLYDLCIELIKQDGNWDMVLEFERENSKGELFDLLQGILDPEEFLVPAIARKVNEQSSDILFLTGVGEVYPYLRSHTLLNNLQSTIKDQPMVMFYPGKYVETGEGSTALFLFESMRGNPYYRAFNILKYQI
ncbi:MAG: DUF1788 domain-containing protein [Anaerolineaceae bacterium]|nr:DUF1788 domain-containing protein [Anaerolineaceae bacterium]